MSNEFYIAPKAAFDATADAIRAKTGSQASIEFTQDGFADAIEEIGGNNREDLTSPKDVDFIDFDGKLLYSYTAQDFLALSALPANPSYPGLTAQGWNWTLVDAQAYVRDWGALVIGQNYTTNDGKTRVYLNISDAYIDSGRSLPIYIRHWAACSYEINWGDGTIESFSRTGDSYHAPNHKYNNSGEYLLTIDVTSGEIGLGYWGANYTLVGAGNFEKPLVTKVEIGDDVIGIGRQPFHQFVNMISVSFPTSCTGMDTGTDYVVFGDCSLLRGIVFPSGVVGKTSKIFSDSTMKSLRYIAIPKSMESFSIGTFPLNLRKLTLPFQTTTGKLGVHLYHVGNLTHLIIPGQYTEIGDNTANNTYIKKIVIPETVTKMSGSQTLQSNPFLMEIHLKPTTPPTLSYANSLGGGPENRVIYVPYSEDHSILEAYQTATNWSTHASQMQEEPQA